MKKILTFLIIIVCFTPLMTKAAITYTTSTYYAPPYINYFGSGNTSLDVGYLKFTEYDTLLGATAGTATASKALILGASKEIDTLRILEGGSSPTKYTAFVGGDQSADVTYTLPTADSTGTQYLCSNGSGTLSWGTPSATFTGGNITSDCTLSNGVDLMSTTTSGHAATIKVYDNDTGPGYTNVLSWTNGNTPAIAMGSDTSTFALNSSTIDIASGAITGVTTITTSGAVTVGGALSANSWNIGAGAFTATGAVTLGDGTSTVAISSTGMDVSTAGAVSNVTTLSMSGDLTNSGGDILMATGKGVKSSTTTAHTIGVYGYDTDGAYVGALVITNSATPATVLGNTNGTTAISSSDWTISTAGAATGIASIAFDAAAASVTTATTGAGQDLTVGITGAQNSSVIVTSSGTAADAMQITASAGGIDITANGAAADEDIDIVTSASVNLTSTEGAANAIKLLANGGASETIVVTNTQGTAEGAITLTSTAGGIDMDGAAAKDINIAAGQVALVSKDDAASAISLTANIGGSETIVVTNTQGTGTGALTLTATAGGIDIDCAAAKIIDIDGGTIQIDSKTAGAGAIAVTANQGAADTITVTNTQGTGAGAITLTSTAGGITLTSNSGTVMTTHAQTPYVIIDANASSLSEIHIATVELSNSEIKNMLGSPVTLVAAPGANKFIEFIGAVLILDYGANVLTESTDNMVIEYEDGQDITGAIESTDFITAAADTMCFVIPAGIAHMTAATCTNKAIQIFNTGDGEFAGNAGNDTTMTIKVSYRIHADGL